MNQNQLVNIILLFTSLCISFVQVLACSNQGDSYNYINHPFNYVTRRYNIGEKKKFCKFMNHLLQNFWYLRIWEASLEWCHSNVKEFQSKVGENTA